jgi:hypothetical protein
LGPSASDGYRTQLAISYKAKNEAPSVEASPRNATFIPAESGPDRPGGILFLDTKAPSALANKLLAALPRADSSALNTHFTVVPMGQGTLLFDVDQEVDQIFFPRAG